MPWNGYNYEDAIIISERLVKEDIFTSIHIEEFELEARDTKLGQEEITRDIPNVGEEALKNLDEAASSASARKWKPGDILVGKVTPKGETELAPEEKLAARHLRREGRRREGRLADVPSGRRRASSSTSGCSRRDDRDKRPESIGRPTELPPPDQADPGRLQRQTDKLLEALGPRHYRTSAGATKASRSTTSTARHGESSSRPTARSPRPLLRKLAAVSKHVEIDPHRSASRSWKSSASSRSSMSSRATRTKIESAATRLGHGVIKQVKVYIATKQKLEVGDKMAGRHGNKGVVAKIVPEEDMPFLPDGTPIEICLNPLGVPSRMNVGQVLETHLGWACKKLGIKVATPVFDGIPEKRVRRIPEGSEAAAIRQERALRRPHRREIDQEVVVGYIYMMKLNHLVSHKIHARAVGPYSLVTQQPLGGKSPVRRPALRRNGSVGARSLRRGAHPAGTAHRQVRRRAGPHARSTSRSSRATTRRAPARPSPSTC